MHIHTYTSHQIIKLRLPFFTKFSPSLPSQFHSQLTAGRRLHPGAAQHQGAARIQTGLAKREAPRRLAYALSIMAGPGGEKS